MKLIILAGRSPKITRHSLIFQKRLNFFHKHGFSPSDIVVCTDTQSLSALQPVIAGYSQSIEDQPLHTAGAVKAASAHFLNDTEIMVANGDTDITVDPGKFIDFHHSRQSHLSILLKSVPDVSSYGYINLGTNNRIVRYNEKLHHLHIPGYVNGGLYLIKTDIIFNLAPATPVSFEKEVFPSIITLNRPIFGFNPHDHQI